MSEPAFDQEAVNLGLGFWRTSPCTRHESSSYWRERTTMAKKRTKTDFTEMNERVRQAREYIARRTEKMRQQRAKEATQPKPD